MKSVYKPRKRRTSIIFFNQAYQWTVNKTGVDIVQESKEYYRTYNALVFDNLDKVFSGKAKSKKVTKALNKLSAKYIRRSKRFYTNFMAYAYSHGALEAIDYLKPFVSDATKETERIKKKFSGG